MVFGSLGELGVKVGEKVGGERQQERVEGLVVVDEGGEGGGVG